MQKMTATKEMLMQDKQTMTVPEIAEKYGISVTTARRYLQKYGLTQGADRTDIKDDEVKSLYENGMTINEIAKHFGCSHDTITKRLLKMGIQNTRAEGIKRHFAPTYEARWNEIKADLDRGMSMSMARDKYRIRMDNLQKLMHEHGYLYDSDALRDRLKLALFEAEEDMAKDKRRRFKVYYLRAIKEIVEEIGALPDRKMLAEKLGIAYGNVCLNVHRMNLDSFIAHSSESSSLKFVCSVLSERNIRYELNNRDILDKKEIDIWLPDLSIGIEVNPVGTHSIDTNIGVMSREYHQKKALLAEEKGIGLLHLYDYDIWNEKRFSKIMDRLTKEPDEHIGARKCEVRRVSQRDANLFLNIYHLQGAERASNIRFGLYYENELAALLAIGKSRFSDADYEIIRYCTDWHIAISGGFERLFSRFVSTCESGQTIVSYMDLNKRFRAKSIYEQVGFIRDGVTPPDYTWVHEKGRKWYTRYETMKDRLVRQGYDPEKTEAEIMLERRFFRVFGAGSVRYLYKIS